MISLGAFGLALKTLALGLWRLMAQYVQLHFNEIGVFGTQVGNDREVS